MERGLLFGLCCMRFDEDGGRCWGMRVGQREQGEGSGREEGDEGLGERSGCALVCFLAF